MLAEASDLLMEIATKDRVSPRQLYFLGGVAGDPNYMSRPHRVPSEIARTRKTSVLREFWEGQLFLEVFFAREVPERSLKRHFRWWQRFKLQRFLFRTGGSVLLLLAVLGFFILSLVGTGRIFDSSIVRVLLAMAISGVIGFAIFGITELAQRHWPVLFQNEPRIALAWEELVGILRYQVKPRKEHRELADSEKLKIQDGIAEDRPPVRSR